MCNKERQNNSKILKIFGSQLYHSDTPIRKFWFILQCKTDNKYIEIHQSPVDLETRIITNITNETHPVDISL